MLQAISEMHSLCGTGNPLLEVIATQTSGKLKAHRGDVVWIVDVSNGIPTSTELPHAPRAMVCRPT